MAQTASKALTRGVFPWFFQRITAVLLVYFLGMHIIILHFIRKGLLTFASVGGRMAHNPGFYRMFYFVFLPSLAFHMMNGLWSVFLDYNPPEGAKKPVLVLLWAAGITLTAAGMTAISLLLKG